MAIVFVTGATGFIGKQLIGQLVKNGHTVLALIRSRQRWEQALGRMTAEEKARCHGLSGDLREEGLGLSSEDYERVLHADVIIHAGVPMDISLEESVARRVILQGASHLLALAKELQAQNRLHKLIHVVGYMSPYDDESGKMEQDVFAETPEWKEAGGYEKYKFLADLLLRQEALKENLPLIVVNPSTVVGPRHTGSTEQTDGLGLLIRSMREGKFPVLPWGREWWLPLIAVDDLAQVIAGLVDTEQLDQQTYYALNAREGTPDFPAMVQFFAKELRMKPPTVRVSLAFIKKVLHSGGHRFLGVPANAMDFIVQKDFPLHPVGQLKQQRGIADYEMAYHLPHVVADLDYRLSAHDQPPTAFVRERIGPLAAYHKAGTKGAPWLFLHGLFSDMSDFFLLAERLQEDVWLVDLPGFGRSPYHHREGMIDGYLEAVAQALRELPSPVHLVGHSFGGYVAAKLAERVPERIEQLYLLQPPLQAPEYPTMLKKVGSMPALLDWIMRKQMTPERMENMLLEQGVFHSTGEIPSGYARKASSLLQSPRIRKTNLELLRFFMNEFAKKGTALSAAVPTEVIWGVHDKVYQLSSDIEQALNRQNIGVEKLKLGHHFPLSHPELTAELLIKLRNKRSTHSLPY